MLRYALAIEIVGRLVSGGRTMSSVRNRHAEKLQVYKISKSGWYWTCFLLKALYVCVTHVKMHVCTYARTDVYVCTYGRTCIRAFAAPLVGQPAARAVCKLNWQVRVTSTVTNSITMRSTHLAPHSIGSSNEAMFSETSKLHRNVRRSVWK